VHLEKNSFILPWLPPQTPTSFLSPECLFILVSVISASLQLSLIKQLKNRTQIYADTADLPAAGRLKNTDYKNASIFDFALKSIDEVNLKSVFIRLVR
jgi:hypothetical protein